MGEIHELFVLALSLVWFAGATPEIEHNKVPSLEMSIAYDARNTPCVWMRTCRNEESG